MSMLFEIFDPKAAPKPIGIDLGTTNSLVACVRNEKPIAIADCNGEMLLPSVVSYAGKDVIVGTPAMRMATEHPRETIISVKRFMGRGADDPETRQLGPYEFDETKSDVNTVRFRVKGKSLTPVEVSADILRELKKRAEDELGKVGGAVITVPAYFDDAQRQATKDAARLAGLDVLRLLNEPTAAALAYGLQTKQNGHFVVYDLGGGTFDVTVLFLEDGVFQVKSTGGDSQLGGDDMDRAIGTEILEQLGWLAADKAKPKSLTKHPKLTPAVVRLVLDQAREIKHALTTKDAVDAEVPLPDGGVRNVRITRARFDELIAPLLERTGTACKRAMRDAGLKNDALDGVILVGGATRVPAVRSYVKKTFGKEPLTDVDPDQVVALGAAVQADLLAGQGRSDEVLLLDVIPLSLGIEVGGGVVDKILPRNTTIPTAARATYTTQQDNQTGFEVHVVQGEREMVADGRSLARFTLKGIPPMPAGLARLEVTFRVDADGLLEVHAKETTTGIEQNVEVKPSYGLDDETVERMLTEALDYGEEDLTKRRVAEGRVESQRIMLATRKSLETDADLLEGDEKRAIEQAMRELETACGGEDPRKIQNGIDELDRATKSFAGRRMNRAIARAIGGRMVDEVNREVEHAKGIEHAHDAPDLQWPK